MQKIYKTHFNLKKEINNCDTSLMSKSCKDECVLVSPYSCYYVKEIITGKKIKIGYLTWLKNGSKKNNDYVNSHCETDLTGNIEGLKTIKKYLLNHKNISEWEKELDLLGIMSKNEVQKYKREFDSENEIQKQEKKKFRLLVKKIKADKKNK